MDSRLSSHYTHDKPLHSSQADRPKKGHCTQDGNTHLSGHSTQQLEGSGLTFLPGDPALLLEMSQATLYGRRGTQPHRLHHLANGRAVSVSADVIRQPVVQLLLSRRQLLRKGLNQDIGTRQYICT